MTATPEGAARYALLPPDRPADELEGELLARWSAEGLFAQTLAAGAGGEPFVFYEGPPTANGRPGIHHVFARTIKDLFCRHRAMRGHDVARKAGWDTHGLPVEIEVEKQLGISGKQDIERVGVEEFNRLCRESVWKYRGDWEQLSARIGYWLDYDAAYATLSHDYVESVWWALKSLHDRDRLYRGHKILPYCPRCGTALSSHEVAQGYQDVQGPSVYVALDLIGEGEPARRDAVAAVPGSAGLRRRILVWTTTPWTLVSNTALAVNPELEYVELRKKTGAEFTLVLAEARAGGVLGGDWADRWDVVARMHGTELVGQRYRRPLDWIEYGEGAHEIIVGEPFVSAEDGSGVVHMAPAFGADDYAAGRRHGLAFVQPVNGRGEFDAGIPLVAGMFVKAADPVIVEELARRDVLWKAGTLEHSYPHCWRCGTPLLYYARSSWFVRTTAFKDEMLARNAQVGWRPTEVGEGRFGEWLRNNVDWAVSRDRYWGTPLPVWVNDEDADEIEVVGSYAELAAKVGAPLPEDFDPHKPHIDRYTWPAPSGRGTMRRVSEVIDTWFDSGSMPFAQWHYPFENRETFERQFPGDFIAEGVDQTRGWFYSLLAIAAGLGDALPRTLGAAPYRNVVVNDLVLDASGQKMSKSRGNTVDPWDVLGSHGADAVRLFLVSSSQVWVPRRFDENTVRETAGRFLLTFKNVYSGIFAQYANFGWSPSADDPAVAHRPAIDRWVLSRLATVEREADALLGDFDATGAARRVMEFFDTDVSKWYVRRSRARFYDVDAPHNRSAFATLHEVLVVTARLLAPFAPFVTDWVHRELTGGSVHLARYVRGDGAPPAAAGAPHHPPAPADIALEAAMGAIRELVTQGHAARDEAGINVRQPLSRMVCVVPQGLGQAAEAALPELLPLLAAELNVKTVEFASSADSIVTLEAKPNFRALGKRFGKSTPLAAQAVASLTNEAIRAFEQGAEVAISVEGASHLLERDDVTILRRASGALVVAERGGYFAALDAAITPELRREGLARELVSRVQRLRKETGLAVSDRIVLTIDGDAEVEASAREHRAWIAEEVLATVVVVAGEDEQGGRPAPRAARASAEADVDGLALRVTLQKDDF